MFRLLYALLILMTLSADPGKAALVPLGDWPGDGTRTALEFDGQLFRNCGRILERWDLGPEPPELLDSLVLDSPPIDLLVWDDLLLVLRDDGLLEARYISAGMDVLVWQLTFNNCPTQLLRHGPWLLVNETFMSKVNLSDPRVPQVFGMGDFGGHVACFQGDTLAGDYTDCVCDYCWDESIGFKRLRFDDSGPGAELPWALGGFFDWYAATDVVSVDGALAVAVTDYLGDAVYLMPGQGGNILATYDLVDDSGGQSICLAARDSLLMVSTDDRLLILEASASESPYLLPMTERPLSGGRDLRLDDHDLLVAGADRTTRMSIADPLNPLPTLTLPAYGDVLGMGKCNEHLLVRQEELRVFQSSGTTIDQVAALPLPPGRGLETSGNLALVQVADTLVVISLALPSAPIITSWISIPGLESYRLDGTRACCLADGELVVYSLENPDQPMERFRQEVGVVNVLAAGGGVIAYDADHASLQIVDARNLEDVHVAGTLPWHPSWVQEMIAFCGDRLATAWMENMVSYSTVHLELFDLSNPSQPQLEAERTWDFSDLCGLWGSLDRLLIAEHLQPIWGYPTGYHLYDLVEGVDLVETAQWEIEPYELTPVYTLLEGGWIARHFIGAGVDLQLDDSIVGVEPPTGVTPDALSLAAAPNPFNPRTVLDFSLAQAGPARLAVYDLRGREVAVLLDGRQAAGAHQVAFEGEGLASGLYLARLETAAGARAIKLALVR